MSSALAPWVRDAARLPIAFAQVREDALLDEDIVLRAGTRVRAILVASGGCTAARLASLENVRELVIVDPNSSQMALARLKLQLLRNAPEERLALLGHRPLRPRIRARLLERACRSAGADLAALGPAGELARLGPDLCGRYERVFAALRAELEPQAQAVSALLALADPAEQARRAAPGTRLGAAIDRAFARAMSLANLIHLFGRGATGNRRLPFSRHFAARTRHVLSTSPAAGNPYLAQVLLGRFHDGALSPWLTRPAAKRLPVLRWRACAMDQALSEERGGFGFVHLSNILDWLDPASARRLLGLAWRAMAPGGRLIIRQLNSRLDIRSLGGPIRWDDVLSSELAARDRSYFYRALHVGRKP